MSKNKQNKLLLAIDGLLLLTMFGSGVYAAITSVVSVENEISVGAVNIELEHYRDESGAEQRGVYESENIAGKDSISSMPRIKNLGISSYIRLLVNYSAEDGSVAERATANDLGADWTEIGDYYYLTRKASVGETLDVFKGITIPASWSEDNSKIVMTLKAEAVQSAHFEPDFTSTEPWGVISIKEFDDNYQIDSEEHTSVVTISYDDSAEKYVTVPDDFLTRLNMLAPGDVASSEITVANPDTNEHEIWMDIDITNSDLSDTFEIIVTRNGETLYEGPVSGLDDLSLGKYSSGNSDTIKIELKLPVDADNSIGNIVGAINWRFRVDKKDEPDPEAPKTVDNITTAVVIFLASFMGLLLVSIFEKRSEKEQ